MPIITIALIAGAGLTGLGVGYFLGYRFGWTDADEQRAETARLDAAAGVIRLSPEHQIPFAKALINPSDPGERWKRAAKRHAALAEPRNPMGA